MEVCIPKIFHSVWIGPNPLPDQERRWIDSWLHHHPEWEHRMWTDDCLPALKYPDLLAGAANPAQASDIIRFELMASQGGVYLDTDMECFRPLDPLLERIHAFIGLELPGRPGQAILGSVPAHPFFVELLDRLPLMAPFGGDNLSETGPVFFASVLSCWFKSHPAKVVVASTADTDRELGYLCDDEFLILHPWVFYPYFLGGNWRREDHMESFGAHHWRASWL
jgi:mannosyltransferase OCH1-like enzyme